MLNFRNIVCGIILCGFAASAVSTVSAQTVRRRIIRQDFKQIEVYVDGGRYIMGMSNIDNALFDGSYHLVSVIPYLDPAGILVNPDIYGENKKASGTKSFGGGVNFNLNPNLGLGIKFLFNQHTAQSLYYAENQAVSVLVQELEGYLMVDVLQSFQVDYKYHVAPIILNGYYRWKPLPNFRHLTLNGGAGIGLYITAVEVLHQYKIVQDAYSIYINLPDQFYNYTSRKVVQPLGGCIFGGVDLQGSSVISVFLNAEYHFVPSYTFKDSDWAKHTDLWYYPSTLDFLYGFNLGQAFNGYNPQKLSLSGLRLTSGIKFAF